MGQFVQPIYIFGSYCIKQPVGMYFGSGHIILFSEYLILSALHSTLISIPTGPRERDLPQEHTSWGVSMKDN